MLTQSEIESRHALAIGGIFRELAIDVNVAPPESAQFVLRECRIILRRYMDLNHWSDMTFLEAERVLAVLRERHGKATVAS